MQTLDFMEKTRPSQEYIEALREELNKIRVFHRELPLSLQIITQVVESYRQQMEMETQLAMGRSEIDEISSEGRSDPVLEEFIPIKRSGSSSDEEKSKERSQDSTKKKPDWLKSAQLWNPEADLNAKEKLLVGAKRSGGAFHPFNREETPVVLTPKQVPAPVPAASSTAETGNGRREEKEGESNRKARRCWSPELHRRFLHALQQLGGSHAATPKQIRDLMKVDGLTNDEVKSHLQKYRLHTRRPVPAVQNSSSSSPQPPQFVVVSGIWVPPPEYAPAVAAAQPPEVAGVATSEIYAPVATLPQGSLSKHQQQKQEQRSSALGPSRQIVRDTQEDSSLADDNVNSNSPSSSSSSHTTTTSPAI